MEVEEEEGGVSASILGPPSRDSGRARLKVSTRRECENVLNGWWRTRLRLDSAKVRTLRRSNMWCVVRRGC